MDSCIIVLQGVNYWLVDTSFERPTSTESYIMDVAEDGDECEV